MSRHSVLRAVVFGRHSLASAPPRCTLTPSSPPPPPAQPLKPIVLEAILDAFNELDTKAVPLVTKSAAAADTAPGEADTEVVALIKELLETRIRPAVQEDGGDIFFEGFEEDTGMVRVRMAGSCVGCPSSTATLRNGVENMLMHYIPEVRGITQVETVLDEVNKSEVAALEDKLRAAGAEV